MTTARSSTGCGAPSVWSPEGRATVLSCIGCGRIDTAQGCAGTCGEYRLEIVPAAAHDGTAARVAARRARLNAFTALAARLAAHAPGTDGWEVSYRAFQAEARAVLHTVAAAPERTDLDADVERLTVWSCGCCGRVEAEAPCIGVCTDERLEVVRADVHDEVRAELESMTAPLRDVSAVVRQLAFVTPRPGGWETTFRALRGRARALVGAEAR